LATEKRKNLTLRCRKMFWWQRRENMLAAKEKILVLYKRQKEHFCIFSGRMGKYLGLMTWNPFGCR
jgi:hypothetical protein